MSDLVNLSGREDMPVSDRIGLLRAELMLAPFGGVSEATIAATRTIHDIKLTIVGIRGIIDLCERAYARGETDVTLGRGAHLMLSPIECLVLAWKRGGHREYLRVRTMQRKTVP
jgi:hypothetical protein